MHIWFGSDIGSYKRNGEMSKKIFLRFSLKTGVERWIRLTEKIC